MHETPRPPATHSRKRAALANTLFSFTSTIVAIVTGLVFVPLYLAWLGAPGYGVWLASGNILAWLSLIDPGIGDLARQRIAALLGEGRWQSVRTTVFGGLIAMLLVACVVAATGILCARPMVAFLKVQDPALESEAAQAFGIAAVGSALVIIGTYLCGTLQGLHLATAAGTVALSASLVVPFVRLALLASGWSLASFAWATVCQGGVLCLAAGAVLARTLATHPPGPLFSLAEIRYLFSMSLFTSLTRLAGTISNNMLAVLITRHLGPSATVSFEMTRQPIEIARTFLDKPASAFLPSFAHLAGARDMDGIRRYVTRYLCYLAWMLGLAAAGLSMLNEAFVSVWVGPDLFAGTTVNGLLTAGLVTAALGNACRLFLYAFGRIAGSSMAALAETMAAVALAIVSVRVAGTAGLAASPLIVSLVLGVWLIPRVILREYLTHHDRLALLTDGVLPSCGAFLASVLALWCLGASSRAAAGWTWLVLFASVAAGIYVTSLWALSAKARDELRLCVNKAMSGLVWLR